MTDKVVTTVMADRVRLEFVRESVRGGRETLALVDMTPDQAHTTGADLVAAAKSVPGALDPASTGGA